VNINILQHLQIYVKVHIGFTIDKPI